MGRCPICHQLAETTAGYFDSHMSTLGIAIGIVACQGSGQPVPEPPPDMSGFKMTTIRDPGSAGTMFAFAALVVVVLILVLVMS